MKLDDFPILVRGAGELASGLAWHLRRAGFPVAMTERARPLAVRRLVAFASAVSEGRWEVEGVAARLCAESGEIREAWAAGEIALFVDESLRPLDGADFFALVDARMLKTSDGIVRGRVPVTMALGPGIEAGRDVDFVVETRRGHDLGRVYREGWAAPNTGVPGEIAGESARRVLHAPAAGTFRARVAIGDIVEAGDLLALIGDEQLRTAIAGRVRGLIADGLEITKGLKVADVDPRGAAVDPATISEKCRAIAAGVLTTLLTEAGKA